MRLRAFHTSKLLVVFALICAMASSGFAHRGVTAPFDPELAAYVAAGGALDDLCGHPAGSSDQGTQSCEACRLLNAIILPSLDPACTIRLGEPSRIRTPQGTENLISAKLDLIHAARGPPAV